MKTILLATDFSQPANRSVYAAAQIASKQNARLMLFHSYRFMNTYDDNFGYPIDEIEKLSLKKLSELKGKIEKEGYQNLEIITCIRHGSIIDTIEDVINEFEVSMVVMSSVGGSSIGIHYFGGTVIKMIHKLKMPMLILPPGFKVSNIENVVMAVDLKKPIDESTLEKSIYFLRDLNAIVDVLYVAKSTAEADSEPIREAALHLRSLLKNVPHTFGVIIGKSQVQEITGFVKKRKAQLLITFPAHHTFFENIFLQGNTRRLVFDVEAPVLALQ
ncbi:universal stress protein [Emticicia sp. 17c]|uniref:universal stress protein n=1 Tax=Emticicia sp. 17c TaxID=3127704 RepID=UPI00301E3D68